MQIAVQKTIGVVAALSASALAFVMTLA